MTVGDASVKKYPEQKFSLNKLGNKLRNFKIPDRSVLLVKEGTGLATGENIEQIAKGLENIGVRDVLLIVVDDLDDVKSIPEKIMNDHGWFRIKQLTKVIKKEDQSDAETTDDVDTAG